MTVGPLAQRRGLTLFQGRATVSDTESTVGQLLPLACSPYAIIRGTFSNEWYFMKENMSTFKVEGIELLHSIMEFQVPVQGVFLCTAKRQ